MKKLNLGCGNNIKKGFVNVDKRQQDMNKFPYKFKDSTFDYILAKSSLQYANNFLKVMSELHRVSRKGAIIEVLVPHCSSPVAFSCPEYRQHFALRSMDCLKGIKVLKRKLVLQTVDKSEFSFINIFNFLFNFCSFWQRLMQRVFFIGFEEIQFRLEVIK